MRYTYDDVIKAVKESKSIANTLKLLGLKPKGGNYRTIKNFFKDNNIDINHFTGQRHNIGDDYKRINKEIPLIKYLVNDIILSSSRLKKRLIKEGVKENKCENCELNEWMGGKIPLELHHMDGNHYNNLLNNLKILCPNCHTLTPNYRGKNKINVDTNPKKISELYPEYFTKPIKKEKIIKEGNYCSCGEKIKKSSKNCINCYRINSRKVVDRPSKQLILELVKEFGYTKTGEKYNVSDNTIRNWLK